MLLLPSPTMKFWRRSEQKYIPRIRMYTLSRQAQPLPPPIRKRLIMHLFIKKMLEGLCWCSSKDFLIPSYLEIYTLHALTKIIGIIVFHTKSLQLITKVLHLNRVTRMKLPRFRPSSSVSRHCRLLAVACSLTSLKVSHAFLGSVMPPYMGAHLISYRHYDRMHSPPRPEQHENSFLLATSSGSPSAPLKIIQHSWPIKKHFTSSL